MLHGAQSRLAALPVTSGKPMLAPFSRALAHKTFRRRLLRFCLVALNVGIVAAVLGLVISSQGRSNIPQSQAALPAASTSLPTGPVDKLASVSIAITAARMAGLPETLSIINQADSANIEEVVASANQAVVSKPQTVTSNFLSNKDIHTYITQAGDNVSSIATKFGVSSDSIRWSNNLQTNNVALGQTLYIPPVNGIVYVVKSGDTPSKLAATYRASEDKIIASNDAEVSGLRVGERIIIPDGSIVQAPTSRYSGGLAWGSNAIYGFNGYDFGYCTYYVATQIATPANWGNANTWDNGARLSGWTVSSVPQAGSIGQTDAGSLGHVAYVYAVSDDHTMIKYRDMNGLAGYARVGDTVNYYPPEGWVPASHFQHYIYH